MRKCRLEEKWRARTRSDGERMRGTYNLEESNVTSRNGIRDVGPGTEKLELW